MRRPARGTAALYAAAMASDRVSPTAHYTAHVWARNGLAHPALAQAVNPWLFRAGELVLRPLSLLTGSPTAEAALLQRHHGIDALLTAAIEGEGVTQVVEVPGGLASRGRRMVERYPHLTYVEGDLPGMAARKRRALAGSPHPRHHVVDVDLLADHGPRSLEAATAPHLQPGAPTAFITEGLLYYLSPPLRDRALARTAAFLGGFSSGRYLADLAVGGEGGPLVVGFLALVSVVARGRVQAHWRGVDEAAGALRALGFSAARLLPATADPDAGPAPGEVTRVHLIDARTTAAAPPAR